MSTKNIKIQNKLETPEGYIVKIEIIEDASRTDMIQIEGLLENPTNNLLKSTQFEVGILYKYVDEYSLDKNSEWSILRSGVKYPGDVEPRHSAPLELRSFPISTLEIKPYMIVYGNVVGGNVYPPCFTDDPRNQCYDTKYVAGEGYINVPKY